MEATEQELKQNEDQWDSLTFGKTEDDCKGKNLLNWRKDTRALLSKVKSSSLDEIKAMVKIPESMQKVLDAYLTLLKFKTAKARTQAIKEFKDRKFDLLKAAKTFKPADLTYGDCKQIQELLAGLEADKVGLTNVACRDLMKWTSNMVLLRIAEALYPESVKAAATPSKPSEKAKKSTEESNVQPTKNSEESKVETVQSTEETKDNVDTHVEPTPVEPTPAEPTPAEPTPVEPAPVEPAPVEPTPAEPTPTETKSAEQKPKKTKQPKVKPIEPKKTPAKRPTTAVTKKPKTNKVDEEEKKEPTTKDKSEEPSVVTKKPTVPKVKRKKKEEEKEDWSIFGTFDENPDPTQVQAFTQNLRSSLETLTKRDITEITSFKKPPQALVELFTTVLMALKYKVEKDAEQNWKQFRSNSNKFLHELVYFDVECISYKTLKSIKLFLEKYPEVDTFTKISKASHGIYLWVKGVYNYKLFIQNYCLKARLSRNPSWEALVCIKTEEEVTAESFTTWMTATFEGLNQLDKPSLTELKALAVPPKEITKVIKAIASLFGCKTDKDISKFKESGFKSITCEQFIEALKSKRIDDLTLEDCINIQSTLDGLTTAILRTKSLAASVMIEFVHNFSQLRIAVAKYGERTGYRIEEPAAKPEEEKKEVDA